MIPRTPRKKLCRCGCGEKFVPTRQMQPTRDNFDCKVRFAERHAAKARERREKAERQELRARREKIKRTPELRQEAQEAANAYVRFRDRDEPCISCGRRDLSDPLTGGAWDCGHYRSVGSAPHLRFDVVRNMAKQCKHCNRDLGGNHVGFRRGLIERIGVEAVEALEADNGVRRYRGQDYREVRDFFRAELKALKAGKSSTG